MYIHIRGDQGQNRRTYQPGQKCYLSGKIQAICENSHPVTGIAVQPPEKSSSRRNSHSACEKVVGGMKIWSAKL